MPAQASKRLHHQYMGISLCHDRAISLAQYCAVPGCNDHCDVALAGFGSAATPPGRGIHILICQHAGHDQVGIGINRQMQLAPTAPRALSVFLHQPLAGAVDLQARAVDEHMQWPLRQTTQRDRWRLGAASSTVMRRERERERERRQIPWSIADAIQPRGVSV